MSDSVRPHRWQPTKLRRPWDSPGKNTGVGCHFLLQCMKVKVKSLSKCPTLRDPMDYSLPGSSIHGIFQARVLEWVAIAFSLSVYTFVLFSGWYYASSFHCVGPSGSSVVKNLPANAGDTENAVSIPGFRGSPEVGNDSHSSILAWKTAWIEEPGGQQSMGLHSWTQLSDWTCVCARAHTHTHTHTHIRLCTSWISPCFIHFKQNI